MIAHALETIQAYLVKNNLDGWLIYDNHGSNRFARQVLAIPSHAVLTRRFFVWIPASGAPHRIVHRIEEHSLDFLPGSTRLYLPWSELQDALKEALRGKKRILMEYSPRGANPTVSVIDGGTLELVREAGVEVLSSADLLQQFTSVLSSAQIATHLEAAAVLEKVVSQAFTFITEHLRGGVPITEYDVQQFMALAYAKEGCVSDHDPICAVNAHSAMPHYHPTKTSSAPIQKGDFILLDLWSKKDHPDAVYADIARVAVAAASPTARQQEIFTIVKTAQSLAADFVRRQMEAALPVHGAEVDDVCRNYIKACGFGDYFTHRTGHNIDTQVHGAGAHLDNLETSDYRLLLPGMCFSIEPGIYLNGEFGVRLESDLLIHLDGSVQITGGVEETIQCLLA